MKIGHWCVKVPAGEFMAGTHRFETKRAALAFRNEWLWANPDALQVPKLSNDSVVGKLARVTRVRATCPGVYCRCQCTWQREKS